MAPNDKIQEIGQHLFCNEAFGSTIYSILMQYKNIEPIFLLLSWT